MVDRGKLTGSLDDLQPAEKAYAEEQLRAGHDVEVVRTGARRTPDFKIDGQLIELKTISGIKDQSVRGISKALSSRIMDARGQSPALVVDARNQSGMTRQTAEVGIARALGAEVASVNVVEIPRRARRKTRRSSDRLAKVELRGSNPNRRGPDDRGKTTAGGAAGESR